MFRTILSGNARCMKLQQDRGASNTWLQEGCGVVHELVLAQIDQAQW